MAFAVVVIVLAYFDYYCKCSLAFLALILVPLSSAAELTSVHGLAIFCSSEQGSTGCPGTEDVLPNIRMAALPHCVPEAGQQPVIGGVRLHLLQVSEGNLL